MTLRSIGSFCFLPIAKMHHRGNHWCERASIQYDSVVLAGLKTQHGSDAPGPKILLSLPVLPEIQPFRFRPHPAPAMSQLHAQ